MKQGKKSLVGYREHTVDERARLLDERAQRAVSEPSFEQKYAVRATGLGPWPGTQNVDAIHRVRGELGAPHYSYLPALEDRGYAASTLARTIATFEELGVDGASFGWRLHDGYSAEQDTARATLDSDINALADVIAGATKPQDTFKLQFTGPLSLTAALHLHNGERSLADRGARRDIRDSWLAGMEHRLHQIKQAIPAAQLYVQLDEPSLTDILRGSIPTSSGYRTYQPLDSHEVMETFSIVTQQLSAYGVKTALNLDAQTIEERYLTFFDAVASVQPAADARAWEHLAPRIEHNQEIWLAAISTLNKPSIIPTLESIYRPWRSIGLPAQRLNQLVLTENGDLTALSPGTATDLLAHLTETATALAEFAQDAD
ncbi:MULTISPECIES: hypothetical protein [unclassified Rothia (in: high G+C Gram-positive bacteria)]|uniref:hypothetical protein n=1 Tax=unclassified Rothia (in: high G+C Gram-positive bacteria) TaxID=2689056 RepID=UPI001955FE2C|nr:MULTISPECIES: hypothetical protein [unclassified Rothia (in: high G+C Gram-positive bacteria)]MBM7050851.1 hypothetical protein [Rothia sp. ZJ1223]QRZ61025.1 hypothetical protein JR346_07095 [Rothia sp. ZJ932]